MDINLLYSKAGIKKILLEREISANKKLGQNFLIDKNKILQIIDSVDMDGKCVLEIGPGLGAMTAQIAKRAKKVQAIEIDNGFIPVLSKIMTIDGSVPEIVQPENIDEFDQAKWEENNTVIIHGDVLKISLEDIFKIFGEDEFVVCANLPYYITTPIIMKLIKAGGRIPTMVFMMQKELGERIDAKPGTKSYGSLTLALQYHVDVERVAMVSPSCFFPEPRVDSMVLSFSPKKEKPVEVENEDLLFSLIRNSFAMRRKTLYNNLQQSYGGVKKSDLADAIKNAGISEMERAERLTLEDFARLSDCLWEYIK